MAPLGKRKREDDSPKRNIRSELRIRNDEKVREKAPINRKDLRKQKRQLNKLRKAAFFRKEKIPTLESLEKEKEEEERIRRKIKKNRLRQKTKLQNRLIKKREEKEEEARKERELNVMNMHDNKVLKDLEKKLKINKDKKLPKSFREDSLGYVLDYKEEAKAFMMGQGYNSDGDDDDGGVAVGGMGLFAKKLARGRDDDDDSENEFDDDDMEEGLEEDMEVDDDVEGVDGDYDKEEGDEEEDGDDEEEDGDDDEEDYSEEELSKPKDSKKKVRFEVADSSEGAVELSLKITEEESKEDIYGRKMILNNSSNDYVPPSLRKVGGQEGSNQELNRQVMGILNKLSENNMPYSCKECEQLFKNNSRQYVCSALENGITRLCLIDEPCSRLLVVHCSFLLAFLHSQIGTEVSAHLLQFVVMKLCDLFKESEDDGDDQETNKINNCLLLVCQLYDFKIMESILILDITEKFLERFFIKDINLITMLLKEIGPRMRKEDPTSFKELLIKIVSKTETVSAEASSMKKLLTKNLVDLLTILKNNQFHNIQSYDPEAFTRRMKLFSSVVKSSSVIPLKVTLDDIEQCETRGKWWLVGSAWSGRDQEPSKESQATSCGNYDPALIKMAKSHRMDSGIKLDIFCTMMSAEDNDDAFEKLVRLNLKPEQQPEIMHIIITTCLQSTKYNPFYSHLANKFCKYHRRFTMACKCSLWDKLKIVPSMETKELNNLTKMLRDLLTWEVIPLSVLKNVDFTSFDEKTSSLVDKILRHVLTKCDNFVHMFRTVSYDNSFRVLKLSLDFFIRSFYVERRDENDTLTKKANMSLKALNEPPMKTKSQAEANDDDDFYSRFQDEDGNE